MLAFKVVPFDGDGDPVPSTMRAFIEDPAIAEVFPTTTSAQFVLLGVGSGSTKVHIVVNGHDTHLVRVDVAEQPP